MKVLVFDTETTGLPAERNASIYSTEKWPHIIQLSFMVYNTDTNEITADKDYIINIGSNVYPPLNGKNSNPPGFTWSNTPFTIGPSSGVLTFSVN